MKLINLNLLQNSVFEDNAHMQNVLFSRATQKLLAGRKMIETERESGD